MLTPHELVQVSRDFISTAAFHTLELHLHSIPVGLHILCGPITESTNPGLQSCG
jgi:hypothetical protein